MPEVIWVKSKSGTSLWHIYKNTLKKRPGWRGDSPVTWTECLTQLFKETVMSPMAPQFERGGRKYWMKRICSNCQAYYEEVLKNTLNEEQL
jgi:hypothetical protein